MADVTLITGDNGSNVRVGTSGDDLIYGYDPNGPQNVVSSITATRVASGLSQPLFVGAPPGDLSRLFIVEKTGLIKILDLATGQILPTPFLDVSAEISTAGESGLLGLAFDPNFATNGRFYVNLVRPSLDTEIRSYQVSTADPNRADPASATLVIGVDQPDFSNHKGGWLGFGRDGLLYIALGDGGGGGDPFGNAQNINTLLGKMLRLDVNSDAFSSDPNRNYAIPADNPFVDTAGLDEIWALGLRNPFRDSFDRGLGTLFIADVGQNTWEEIDIGQKGANYGWNVFEGPATFAGGTPTGGSAVSPIYSYNHSVGVSVIGGYVYRGTSEGLHGDYFFADLNGKVFTLHFNGTSWNATERTSQIIPSASAINTPVSFGEDGFGNLYIVDIDGEVFRLTPNVTSADAGDNLSGGGGNDMIFAGSGNDVVGGGNGNDTLYGGNGNDALSGDPGNDFIFGGDGIDIAVFSGAFASYSLVGLGGTGVRVSGPDGVDVLSNIERLQFSDQIVTWPPNTPTSHPAAFSPSQLTLAAFGAGSTAGGWISDNLYPRMFADVNGDGMADAVGFGSFGVNVALATGGGHFAQPVLQLAAFGTGSTTGGWISDNLYPRMFADVNGDGMADAVGFGSFGVNVALATGGGQFSQPVLQLAAFGAGSTAGGWISDNLYPRMFADVNGDGMADAVGFGSFGVNVALATGGGQFSQPVLQLAAFGAGTAGGWTSEDLSPRTLADVNGDGMADVVGFNSLGVNVALATGGHFAQPTLELAAFGSGPTAGGWSSENIFPRVLGDVNGDGMADIIAFDNFGVNVALATGGGHFASPALLLNAFGADGTAGGWLNNDLYPRLVADVNGDGTADVAGFGNFGINIALAFDPLA